MLTHSYVIKRILSYIKMFGYVHIISEINIKS